MAGRKKNDSTKITQETFKQAVPGTFGVIVRVAKNLGVTRDAVYKYLDRHPELYKLLDKERLTIVDISNNVVYESIVNGRSVKDAKWVLERLDKKNYSTRVEQEISGGFRPVNINVFSEPDENGSEDDDDKEFESLKK